MNVVLCEYAEKREFTAGNKARTDAVKILQDGGYKHIPLFCSKSGKIRILFQMICSVIRTFFNAGKGDIVFIQYPYHPLIVNQVLVRLLSTERAIKKFRLYILIHDVEGLRLESESETVLEKEVRLLNKADRIICHNDRMADVFTKVLSSDKYDVLGPFDYLYTGVGAKNNGCSADGKYTVVVAGNLMREKCGYLYNLPVLESVRFNLYGIGYDGESNDRVSYRGKYPPDELIDHMEGNFGLVWDGDSPDTCSGVYGQYLRYNNPHKFSLYLAAGLPVIVWKESALAQYVEDNKVGFCINSIAEIDAVLSSMTEKDYSEYLLNVEKVRSHIVNGDHLRERIY